MKCPICHDREHIEIDLHADGFTSGIVKECTNCGAVWIKHSDKVEMLSNPTKITPVYYIGEPFSKYTSIPDEEIAENEKVWFS